MNAISPRFAFHKPLPAPKATIAVRRQTLRSCTSVSGFSRLIPISQRLRTAPEEFFDGERLDLHRVRKEAHKAWEERMAAKVLRDHSKLVEAANAAVGSTLKQQAAAWGVETGIPADLSFSFEYMGFFHHLWLRNLNRKRGYKDFVTGKIAQWRPYRIAMRLEDGIVLVGMKGVESMPLDEIKSKAEEAGFPVRRVRDVVNAVKSYRQYLATLSPSALNMFSMFAGICGMEVASEIFGDRIVPKGVAEILKHQSAVIDQRFAHIKNWGDVTKIDWDKVLKEIASEIHILTAGFPCQDISIAGRRKGFKGKRSVLFFEVIRAILALKPRYVVLENVKALFHTDQRATLKAVVRAMSRAGYVMDVDLLDARDDGLPMSRERMYAVAVRKDIAKHLPRRVSHRKGLAQDALDAVGYKGIGGYLSAPSVAKPSWLNDFIDRDFDPALLMTATQRAECLKKLDSGDQVIPERWMFFPNDNHGAVADIPEVFIASGVTNTLAVNGRSFGQGGGGVRAHTAFTLTTHKGFAVAYQGVLRFLAETEMERLMGFTPGHTAVTVGGRMASYNQRMKALGNSMAVPSAARSLQAVLIMEYFAAAA